MFLIVHNGLTLNPSGHFASLELASLFPFHPSRIARYAARCTLSQRVESVQLIPL